MSETNRGSVTEFPQPNRPSANGGNGGGGDWELRERLSRLEERCKNLATKEDVESIRTVIESVKTNIESVKTLIAEKETKQRRWLIGTLITVVVSLTIALIRTFF